MIETTDFTCKNCNVKKKIIVISKSQIAKLRYCEECRLKIKFKRSKQYRKDHSKSTVVNSICYTPKCKKKSHVVYVNSLDK